MKNTIAPTTAAEDIEIDVGLLSRSKSKEGQTISDKLYEYYTSQGGVLSEGVLKGGLGVITSVMSKDSDEAMLGYHLGLGIIWTALTAKHFIAAGRGYSSLLPKSIEEAGNEISTYAKLCAKEAELSESQTTDTEFTKKVNSEICKTIAVVLAGKQSPLSEEEQKSIEESGREEVTKSLQSRTNLSITNPLVISTGISALVATISAITIPFVEDRSVPIATAALSSFATSVLGSTLENSVRNLNDMISNTNHALRNLNQRKVGEINDTYREELDLEEIRTEVKKEAYQNKQKQEKERLQASLPSSSTINRDGSQNPIVRQTELVNSMV